MFASILRTDVPSRHERHRRLLFRKVTRLTRHALRTIACDASKPSETPLQCSSAAGLLALYGLPFPVIINP